MCSQFVAYDILYKALCTFQLWLIRVMYNIFVIMIGRKFWIWHIFSVGCVYMYRIWRLCFQTDVSSEFYMWFQIVVSNLKVENFRLMCATRNKSIVSKYNIELKRFKLKKLICLHLDGIFHSHINCTTFCMQE